MGATVKTNQDDTRILPVTRELTLAYVMSIIVAVTVTVASVVGLLYRTILYPTEELLLAFALSDAINLAVGLPILLGAMWLARRGRLIGLLCWPGALFFMLYSYTPYLLAVPFNVLFLPHLLIVTLSAYTIIGIVASIDGDAVRQRLIGAVPARTTGGILIGLAVFVIARVIALAVTALTSRAPVAVTEHAQWITDFAVGCPPVLVGGLTLWRRKALGYVTGAGLLLQYGALSVGLIPFLLLQPYLTASPVDVVGVFVILFMAAVCFIPFAFFVRGAASSHNPSPR
jgi:hypothetical protein